METEIVGCKAGCNGEVMECIPEIKRIVESGKYAFMINTEHIKPRLLMMGYRLEYVKKNGIEIGMYISK